MSTHYRNTAQQICCPLNLPQRNAEVETLSGEGAEEFHPDHPFNHICFQNPFHYAHH